MSRHGQAEMLDWFPRIVLMVVAVVVVVVLVNYYSNRDIDASGVERAGLLYRIYFDGNIITYKDPLTGRVYPGIIDIASFDETLLAKKFPGRSALSGESRVAACLGLSADTGPYQARTICTDKAMVDHYLPLAENGMTGPGSATMERVTLPISIKDGASLSPGKLIITVVRRNS